MSHKNELRYFCVCCFADDHSGSWGETTIPNVGFCSNCGAGGGLIHIPTWSVESIRKNASWVGKRYYSADEDYEIRDEIKRLRNTLDPLNCPGRTVEEWMDEEGKRHQMVKQVLPNGRTVSIFTDTVMYEKDALIWALTKLPFYTANELL